MPADTPPTEHRATNTLTPDQRAGLACARCAHRLYGRLPLGDGLYSCMWCTTPEERNNLGEVDYLEITEQRTCRNCKKPAPDGRLVADAPGNTTSGAMLYEHVECPE